MAVITVNGQTITNTSTSWNGYAPDKSVVNTFTFTNNLIDSVNNTGYMLNAGDEIVSSTNGNLNGSIITGNKFNWHGTGVGESNISTHTLFTGYEINGTIKYNLLVNPVYGIQLKASGVSNTAGIVSYNIINNPRLTAIPVKGIKDCKIYNNTIYSTQPFYTNGSTAGVWRGLIDIYGNTDEGQSLTTSNSSGCIIKNNIFYTKYQIYNIAIHDSQSAANFQSDYNVFYCEAGTPIFNYLESSKTFAQWQALGFDTHSIVVNPNFTNFIDFTPATRLDYGTNLGTTYQTGLTLSATWVVGTTPATTNQNGTWQVGARLFAPVSYLHEYYVATNGNDSNPGTISQPFLTIQKGINTMVAGDMVWVRGGTYTPAQQSSGYICGLLISGKTGTSTNKFNISAYNNETVIVSGSNLTSTNEKKLLLISSSSYVYIYGIQFTDCKQNSTNYSNGCFISGCGYITMENCKFSGNGGYGCGVRGTCPSITFLNCDSYNNYDNYNNGTDADGWDVGYTNAGTTITFTGCRAWDNADDGFDCYNPAGYSCVVTHRNCWAWGQGYAGSNHSIIGGDGNGFKPGLQAASGTTTLRFYYNCVAYGNRLSGFNENGALCKQVYYNCISYGNGDKGWDLWNANTLNVFQNNVSFGNSNGEYVNVSTPATNTNNSWNGTTVNSASFVSTSATQLANARQSNGALPVLTFLHPTSTSSVLAKGVVIGTNTTDGDGNPWATTPAIGAYEYISGTSAIVIPTVTTTTVTSITSTTAASGGNVTSDGGAPVTARGVVWGIWPDPELAYDTYTTNGTGTGSFTSSVTGLSAATTYYLRAYATNSAGTAYGSAIVFVTPTPIVAPSVTTTSITGITYNSATGGGNVTSDGGSTVTARGVCWSVFANPTVTTPTIDNGYTSNGTGTGSFTSSLTSLLSSATGNTYYVRAYATNSVGTTYGNQITFTTQAYTVPTLTTTSITNITATSATSGGTVTSTGGQVVSGLGIVYATHATPSTSDNLVYSGSTSPFTASMTGLSAYTTYYVRSYASNSVGTGYGPQVTFTTSAVVPTITITSTSSVSQTGAVISSTVSSNGGSTITSMGVAYATTPNPTTSSSTVPYTGSNTTFTSTLTGLTASTTYYIRAYAINGVGTSYSAQSTFTTEASWLGISVNTINNSEILTEFTMAGYGMLYNFYAMSDTRNMAPIGWHVIRMSEWDGIFNVIDPSYSFEIGFSDTLAYAIREPNYWNSQGGNPPNTNSSGLSLRPGGTRFDNGQFENSAGNMAWCGSSDIYSYINPSLVDWRMYSLFLYYADSCPYNNSFYYPNGFPDSLKRQGLSTRWVKDDSNDSGYVIGNDGKRYPTVKIGNYVITKKNIAETKYRNGDSIPEVTDDTEWSLLTTGARCYLNNDPLFA